MFTGEYILGWVLGLVTWCSNQLFSIYLFTYNGHGISLGNFLVWSIGISIVIDIFVILNGGSPGDDEWDYDSIDTGRWEFWE